MVGKGKLPRLSYCTVSFSLGLFTLYLFATYRMGSGYICRYSGEMYSSCYGSLIHESKRENCTVQAGVAIYIY